MSANRHGIQPAQHSPRSRISLSIPGDSKIKGNWRKEMKRRLPFLKKRNPRLIGQVKKNPKKERDEVR